MVKHGVYVYEGATAISTPIETSASVQCVVGVAPIYQLDDPASVENVPILATSVTEAMEKLGYCDDLAAFTLCQPMYVLSNMYNVAPIVLINVATMAKCAATNKTVTISAPCNAHVETGEKIAKVGLSVKQDATTLAVDTDYVVSYANDGSLVIDFVLGSAFDPAKGATITGKLFDASKVTAADIIGSVSGGKATGLELIKSVYPMFGIIPSILTAPGFSQNSAVGIALSAKAASINGVFKGIAIVDVDTAEARAYTDVKNVKETSGFTSEFCYPVWPSVKVGDHILAASAVASALMSYTDAQNGDIPVRSASNKLATISGVCLADGTNITLDQDQGNVVNSGGVSTFINMNGWRLWGSYTGAYPSTTDVKDMWINVRRMFNWQSNNFILNYISRVDDPLNKALIESIVDSENIRCGSFAPDVWAAASIQYIESDNSVSDLLAGKITFRQMIAPYVPAQEINCILSYDVDALRSALN